MKKFINKLAVFILNLTDYDRRYRLGSIGDVSYIYKVMHSFDIYADDVFISKIVERVTFLHKIKLPIIGFSQEFELMEDDIKQFIIYRELAHGILHFDSLINMSSIVYEKRIILEHEADKYVANIMGFDFVLESLKKLMFEIHKMDYDTTPIKDRISLLELSH